jgi:uncharacterized protein
MDKELLKKIILENQERIPTIRVFPRDHSLLRETNYIVTGQRRAGKTYLLYQHLQGLIESGVPVHRMLYINFEDERLLEHGQEGLSVF